MTNFGLDYDGTYTRSPELWDQFIESAHAAGHKVYVVTCRRWTHENRQEVRVPGVPSRRHAFTEMAAKKWYCHTHGIDIHVWIDDDPRTIVEGK